jgi:DNA-binding FadR family transcriptional regulator
MARLALSSEFLQYLASIPNGSAAEETNGESEQVENARLPSLNELSKELNVSVASLREQLEVAKALGLVEVRPRTGIRRLPYSFMPAVRLSLFYALSLDRSYFEAFTEMRNSIEAAFWGPAVERLTPEDYETMQELVAKAWAKLRGHPIQIPQREHRSLHLTIFSRLDNPFVQGLLEAYWDAYEAVGLNLYADYDYLEQVWTYHQKMVDAICSGNFDQGYQALIEHKDMLYHRPDMIRGRSSRKHGQAEDQR